MSVSQSQLREGVAILKKGGVIVFPTETAYGLGADATNAQAVQRLMAIKGREGWKTPPLIAATRDMVEMSAQISDVLRPYADQFWPGPLTLVLPIKKTSPLCTDVIREGTIAVRVSSQEVAQELSRALGAMVVATSANRAGQETCYDIASVRAQFDAQLLQPDFYLDAGPLPPRPPSTIIAEQDGQVAVLRKGEIYVA